jgi:hypothetical protein
MVQDWKNKAARKDSVSTTGDCAFESEMFSFINSGDVYLGIWSILGQQSIGEHFENVSISNVTDVSEFPLAFMDVRSSEEFQTIVEEIEVHKVGMDADDESKDYEVYIYHLNTDNRRGNAFIRNADNVEEMSKPKIHINGDEPLEQTKYTESLYLSKWIHVRAKAKRIGGKFKHLEIDFEN